MSKSAIQNEHGCPLGGIHHIFKFLFLGVGCFELIGHVGDGLKEAQQKAAHHGVYRLAFVAHS